MGELIEVMKFYFAEFFPKFYMHTFFLVNGQFFCKMMPPLVLRVMLVTSFFELFLTD